MKNIHLENRQIAVLPIPLFIMADRDVLDIDELIRGNLRRILIEKDLKQNYVADLIGVSPSQISDILSGLRNMGKDLMTRLCKELNVEPWEFYRTDRTPIISNPREAEKVYRYREEEKLGIAEEIAQYEEYRIDKAKKRGKKSSTERMLEALDALESTEKKKRRSA